jgi:hypothetical protein
MPRLISIDIGKNNLGYSLITYGESVIKSIKTGLVNIDSHFPKNNIVSSRCYALTEFIEQFIPEEDDIYVIERQSQHNMVAMCLMYSIMTVILQYVEPEQTYVFDPKLKFTTFRKLFSTKNKEHKKLSISIISDFLKNNNFEEPYAFLTSKKKQDDISDSLLQGLAQLVILGLISEDILAE